MEIVLYILGVIGFTDIIVNSVIMQPVREWFHDPYWPSVWPCIKTLFTRPLVWMKDYITTPIAHMMGCPQCSGFWCGLLLGWLVLPGLSCWQILAAGFSGSFLAMMASIVMNYLEAQTIVRLQEEHKDG